MWPRPHAGSQNPTLELLDLEQGFGEVWGRGVKVSFLLTLSFHVFVFFSHRITGSPFQRFSHTNHAKHFFFASVPL